VVAQQVASAAFRQITRDFRNDDITGPGITKRPDLPAFFGRQFTSDDCIQGFAVG